MGKTDKLLHFIIADCGDGVEDWLIEYFRLVLEEVGSDVEKISPTWTKLKQHIKIKV